MTRVHARRSEVVAIKLPEGGWKLGSPAPGLFRPAVRGAYRRLGMEVIGTLEVLGSLHELVLPAGVTGWLEQKSEGARPVVYGDLVGFLYPAQQVAGASEVVAAAPADDPGITGPVFRSPTSGRYYGRSSPDKPPFVVAGAELLPGATICLLEVMKTFHRVTFDGERCRVRELLVADGADVNAGDPLLALEPT